MHYIDSKFTLLDSSHYTTLQTIHTPPTQIPKMVNTSVYTLCRTPSPAIANALGRVRKDTPKHKAEGKVDKSTPDRKPRLCRKPINPMKEFESILRSLMLYPI